MKTTHHIDAPLKRYPGTGDIFKDNNLIISVKLNSRDVTPEEEDTAQRIVDCYNAMDGIEDPTKLVEDYKSMKALLKEMLVVWDRGDSVSANCVYPNAARFTIGVEPKVAPKKQKEPEISLESLKLIVIALAEDIYNAIETAKQEIEGSETFTNQIKDHDKN